MVGWQLIGFPGPRMSNYDDVDKHFGEAFRPKTRQLAPGDGAQGPPQRGPGMKTLPSVDVVIVGGGWTGLLMAKELGSRTALSVVVLERGGPRKTDDYGEDMDELDYAIRLRMMQDASTRDGHATAQSEPARSSPAAVRLFSSRSGVGGAGEHWNGIFPRFLPDCFESALQHDRRNMAQKRLPEDHAIQDWGVTYDELEPHYARVEALLGISGKAGNIRGKQIEGGNIFEGWRSAEYPTPPTKIPYFSAMFRDAAISLGYHPYPNPAATVSQAYTNPDGITRAGCTYCGFCERFGCMIGAKAQPTNTLLPVIQKRKNVSIRAGASVRRVVHDDTQSGGRARGVTYIDASGEEVFQPAELVFLASWTLNNTRLLLLSGIGEPYNAQTGKGTLGRNLTHQVCSSRGNSLLRSAVEPLYGLGCYRHLRQ